MPSACLHKNPLLHSGTSQHGRVLKALHPSFAQVDERNAADLILFAKEYSRQLRYFSNANEADGDWQPLMRMNLSVVLATLSNQRIEQYMEFVRGELAWLADKQHTNEAALKERFTGLFNFAYSWLYEVENQSQLLPDEWPYKTTLSNAVRSVLAMLRYKLDRYFQKAVAENLLSATASQPSFLLPFTVYTVEQVQAQYWGPQWTYAPPPSQPFAPQFQGLTAVAKIKNLAVHNLFTGILDSLFMQGALLAKQAGESLEKSFAEFPKHSPHYALFLTFIKLFRFAQDSLNGFTQRHLNFYYRDVLQLQPKPPVPDHVHLVFELQKNVPQALLAKGTLFKAGKDNRANELFYAAEKDVVLNTAAVASMKALLAVSKSGGAYQTVYASPVVNSLDGRGEAIKIEDRSWATFGKASAANLASFGFAVASHMLFLQEGDRTVTLTFETEQNLPATDTLFAVKPTALLSGEKGWEEAVVERFGRLARDPKKFTLVCSLTPTAQAIVPFDAVVHKDVYPTSFPVLKLLFNSSVGYHAAKAWSAVRLRNLVVRVDVVGLKKLVLKNELSVVDTAKPFQPFGPAPYAGSACTVGSHEIFQKEGASVSLNFEWDKVPQPEGIISHMSFVKDGTPVTENIIDIRHQTFYDYDHYVLKTRVSHLQNGVWTAADADQPLFSSREMFGNDLVDHVGECGDLADLQNRHLFTSYPGDSFSDSDDHPVSFAVKGLLVPRFSETEAYSNESVNGFVRLELNRDTGHKDFIQRFTQLAAKQLKPPPEPYVPQAKSLTADYTASVTLNLSSAAPVPARKWQVFSVQPFGVKEESRLLNNSPSFTLTPAFPNEGELYIGLDKAVPDTTVGILFQVSEGSANPTKTAQEVHWHYLAKNNVWKLFEEGKVSDDTGGLLHSGIVAFALPADVAAAPTLMGGALCWLRASVAQSSDAVCNLVDVKAQAIKAVWTAVHNPLLAYTQPAKAMTIGKLQAANPLVKKIEQPYDSFGGRLTETDDAFYVRSSERLRHKKRAVTIWDYERLVLDAFPEIYKVKCLNHTLVRTTAAGTETGDNEEAPGCVVVVPLPDMSRMHSPNPLRPLTPLDTLTNIEAYLKKITSGFVRIQARNPVFEEIVIRCNLKFFGNDPGFYHSLLQEDLQRFLCPWAYDTQSEIEFGGSISKSTLINFIEERPYVDYLTNFRLYLRTNNVTQPTDRETVEASTARSVLVIAEKRLHLLNYQNVVC